MELSGYILDRDDKKPLAGATVELWFGNVMLARSIANSNGYFSASSASSPNTIVVTNAGYKPVSIAYSPSIAPVTIELEKNFVEGEPVIIKSILEKRGGWWVVAGLALFFLLAKKRS